MSFDAYCYLSVIRTKQFLDVAEPSFPFNCSGNIIAPNDGYYSDSVQVPVPIQTALMVVVLIDVNLLWVALGTNFVVDSVIELKQAFCPIFCSISACPY